MKKETLYNAISDIREDFIEEAEIFKFKNNMVPRLLKWGSMAACFCLVVFGASLAMSGAFAKKGALDGYNGMGVPTPTPGGPVQTVLAYNGSLFNVSNDLNYLNAAGIPDLMTSEDCGRSMGNLIKTENGYEETALDTDIELYQYAPAFSNRAVYVIRDGEEYMAGLYSNHMTIGDYNDHMEITGLFRTYGVEQAEQLASVSEVNNVNEGSVISEVIEDASALTAFFDAVLNMKTSHFGRNDFKKLVTNAMSEEEHLAFLESERIICIETYEGLKFYITWYPEDGWFFSEGARAYFHVSEEMQAWLDNYILQ